MKLLIASLLLLGSIACGRIDAKTGELRDYQKERLHQAECSMETVVDCDHK